MISGLVKSTYSTINDMFRGVMRKRNLSDHIATRERHIDWAYMMGYLPNPDPILKAQGKDITVYRDLLVDADIGSCVASRRSGVLSCEYKIEPGAPGRKNQYAADFATEVMSGLDMERIIREITEAELFGYCPIEIMWAKDTGKWFISDLVGKPQEWFVFESPDPDLAGDNGLRFLSSSDLMGEILPPRKFLVPRYGQSYQNPYGLGVLSTCFWPAAFKKGGMKFWLVFTERYGMPWVIGKVPPTTDQPKRLELLTKLKIMVQDAVAVISNDESVEIQGTEGRSASSDLYERFVSFQNREISKALVGHTLNTEVNEHGSNAALQGSLDIRADIVDSSKTLVKKTMNEAFRHQVELNMAGAVVPKLQWFEETNVKKEQSERDKNLIQGDPRLKFKKAYYQREYNFDEADFDLVEADTGDSGDRPVARTDTDTDTDPDKNKVGAKNKENKKLPSQEQQDEGRGDRPVARTKDRPVARTQDKSSFARKEPGRDQAGELTPEQEKIEGLIEQAQAKTPMDALFSMVQEIMESSGSMEEARERILEMYAAGIKSPIDREMASSLAEGMFSAGMFGRYSVGATGRSPVLKTGRSPVLKTGRSPVQGRS